MTVHALHQDRLGYVWLGTEDGLLRFDGRRFLDPTESSGTDGELRHRAIGHLFEDRAGTLWVGSQGGLDRIDVDAAALDDADGPWLDLSGSPVHAVAEDADGRLLIGGDGLALLTPDRRELSLPAGTGAAADHIQALAVDPHGPGGRPGVWIGSADAAPVFRPGGADAPLTVSGLPGPGVRAFAVDPDTAWLATAAGLFRVDKADPDLRAVRDPGPGVELRTALIDHTGRLWAGGDDGLAMRTDDGRWRRFGDDPAGPGTGGVLTLLEDRRGALWVGTRFGGVSVLSPSRGLDAVATPSPVRAVAGDAQGRLWIGTDDDGVCIETAADPACGPIAGLGGLGPVHAILASADGAWLGAGDGLYRTSPEGQTRRFIHDPYDPTSLGPGPVRALDLDRSGRLWVALWGGGLGRLDPGGERFEHFRADAGRTASLPSDRLSVLFRDGRDHLWIGTDAGLVRRTADGRFHGYRRDPDDPTSLRGDAVRA
ncbi:MAG: two-component regulator propeller domain-containing protein, partial [Acidobacteriota bacterium]